MASYLLIESRDPFSHGGVARNYELAANLKKSGDEVTLFLVQNGVLSARKGSAATGLADVVARGVQVLSDEFSMRERGIAEDALLDGVMSAPLDTVVDQLAEGRKALWL